MKNFEGVTLISKLPRGIQISEKVRKSKKKEKQRYTPINVSCTDRRVTKKMNSLRDTLKNEISNTRSRGLKQSKKKYQRERNKSKSKTSTKHKD